MTVFSKKLYLLIIFLILTSCSFKFLVIPNLAYLISEGIDQKLDLSYSQEEAVKKEVEAILYSETKKVKELKEKILKIQFRNTDIFSLYDDLATYYIYFAPKINKILASQIAQFDSERQKNFFEIAEDENETILNRSRKKRTNEILKRYEKIIGDMTDDQKKLVDDNMIHYQLLNKKRLARRLKVQAELREIFKETSVSDRATRIEKLFNDQIDIKRSKQDFTPVLNIIVKIQKTLTKDQLDFLTGKRKEVISWIDSYLEHYSR